VFEAVESFRQFDYFSILLRLALAMFFGGVIGLEGARKGRPAGFRTYMLVCLGAALTMLLGQYELHMTEVHWADHQQFVGARVDVSRFGAQVINGIGFLGAGTIIVTGKQQVKGLTTAAGLWASACVGLAIGAGFYECVILAFALVFLVVRILPRLEERLMRSMRNMNIYVEYDRVEHTGAILNQIRELDAQIYEVEIDRRGDEPGQNPSAVFNIRLKKRTPHTRVLAHISQLEYISAIEEV
jgi:putative Mg2+ transporter-C (MgtC) family protein